MIRRLRRILLNTATVVSFVLCVASLVLWVRSCWAGDTLIFQLGRHVSEEWGDQVDRSLALTVWRGRGIGRVHDLVSAIEPAGGRPFVSYQAWPVAEMDGEFEFMNYKDFHGFGRDRGGNTSEVWMPMWAALAMTALLPARRLWLWRTRQQPGFCPRCGYDLRATPGRCPECGTIPAR